MWRQAQFLGSNTLKILIVTVFFSYFFERQNKKKRKGLSLVAEQNIFKILSHFHVKRVISTSFEECHESFFKLPANYNLNLQIFGKKEEFIDFNIQCLLRFF